MAETFGKTTKGGTAQTGWKNYIVATKFTSGPAGPLGSIKLYVKTGSTAAKVKCAIYKSDLSLLANGTTEEKGTPYGLDDWLKFKFPTPPEVLASTEYWLAFWYDTITFVYQDAGAANQMGYQSKTYGSWPDTLVPDAYAAQEYSIHAVYWEAKEKIKTIVQASLI